MGRKRQEGNAHKEAQRAELNKPDELEDGDHDWYVKCTCCGCLPTVHPTGLCGPCATGDADTAGGNW